MSTRIYSTTLVSSSTNTLKSAPRFEAVAIGPRSAGSPPPCVSVHQKILVSVQHLTASAPRTAVDSLLFVLTIAAVASTNILDLITSTLLHGNLTNPLPQIANSSSAVASATKAFDRLFSSTAFPTTLQDHLYALVAYISSLNSLATSSLALAAVTFLVLAMSWTSRFGNLGRFSPFTRSPNQGGNTTVSDADFSYITSDDLKRHQQQSAPQPTPEELGAERDTDVLVLSNKGQRYAVHFPAYSIARGELSVGQVREQAGKKLGVDARRVKLTFKGKTLKDDLRPARFENLRDHDQILCVAGDLPDSVSGSDDEDDEDTPENTADPESAKRRRNRNKNKKRRNKAKSTPSQNNTGTSTPIPQPTTALGKIAALRSTLQTFNSDVEHYLTSPPPDKAKREFEHKRLSETILTQVLLKLDAVETEGDPDARQKRKDLVRETQLVLKDLDDAAARHAASL